MTILKLGDKEIISQSDETVLDSLLREGIVIPHGCRQGGCFSCIIFSQDANPPKMAQEGLSEEQTKNNGFFACLCKPEQDMTISLKMNT